MTKMSNHRFAKENTDFLTACELTATKPTTRQASKFRNRKGRAYKLTVGGKK